MPLQEAKLRPLRASLALGAFALCCLEARCAAAVATDLAATTPAPTDTPSIRLRLTSLQASISTLSAQATQLATGIAQVQTLEATTETSIQASESVLASVTATANTNKAEALRLEAVAHAEEARVRDGTAMETKLKGVFGDLEGTAKELGGESAKLAMQIAALESRMKAMLPTVATAPAAVTAAEATIAKYTTESQVAGSIQQTIGLHLKTTFRRQAGRVNKLAESIAKTRRNGHNAMFAIYNGTDSSAPMANRITVAEILEPMHPKHVPGYLVVG